MKSFFTLVAVITFVVTGFGQGQVDFLNSSATLISVDGTAMPAANTRQFIFALFLAPSTTVTSSGQTIAFDDPRFQVVAAYNTNHPTAMGRLVSLRGVNVSGMPGQTVDFVVRGWSAELGATWGEALANYRSFPYGWFGSSTVGNDLVLGGGAIPISNLFGSQPWQVGGFNMSAGCLGPYWMGFTSHPTNQSVVLGGAAVFAVSAIACPPPLYQWYFNGNPIPGANKGYYQISNVQPSHAGSYFADLSNPLWPLCCGTNHTSASATLTVLVSPTITSPPASQTAETGAPVRLSVRAAGDPPLVYRWVFNETNVLSVTTDSVLELGNVGPAQAGSYTVVVTNAVGAVTSAPAMLNVIAPVERRMVPRLTLRGQLTAPFNVEYHETLAPTQSWTSLISMDLTNSPDFYFDLASPMPPERFYRAWQTTAPTNPPSLGLNMIPALTLTGSPGNQIRVDSINQFGPTDAWFTLDTVTLTNTSQLYFDVTAPGQPQRLYRLVPVP